MWSKVGVFLFSWCPCHTHPYEGHTCRHTHTYTHSTSRYLKYTLIPHTHHTQHIQHRNTTHKLSIHSTNTHPQRTYSTNTRAMHPHIQYTCMYLYYTHTHKTPAQSTLTQTFMHNLNIHDAGGLWDTPISLPLLPSKLTVGQCRKLKWVRKDSLLPVIIWCHLSADQSLVERRSRKMSS